MRKPPERFPTVEATKAAAQADYETRILAALEPVTAREMPLLEIAEAMQELLARPMGVVPACADKYYDSNTGAFTAELIGRALAGKDT